MATATELADKLERWYVDGEIYRNCGAAPELVAELRRIPDLERRALTDDEVAAVEWASRVQVSDTAAMVHVNTLRRIAERMTPPPQVEWHDVGEGSIAELDGWTLTVRPCVLGEDGYAWSATKASGFGGNTSANLKTIDSAKAAAVEWVRKQGGK